MFCLLIFNQHRHTDVGIPGLNFDDFSSGLFAGFVNVNSPNGSRDINFGSGLGVNRCNCPLDQNEKQYQVVSNLTKVVGDHTLKFGVDVRRAFNLRVPSDNHRSGELTFGQNRTGLGWQHFNWRCYQFQTICEHKYTMLKSNNGDISTMGKTLGEQRRNLQLLSGFVPMLSIRKN